MKLFVLDNLWQGLKIMGLGMLGIFVVMLIIYCVILALAKFTKE